jgi:oligopeptide transport system ATP-binding protein
MSEDLLQVNNLTVRFPIKGGIFRREIGAVRAVNDVSFKISKGETLGIVGESGCGKTTLGRAVVRLYEPHEGSIYFRGQDITHLSPQTLRATRKHIQMIFQDPYTSLNPRLPIGAILDEPLRLNTDLSPAARIDRVSELLQLVGLRPEVVRRYPHEFSGGQRQRVGIARAIALNPDLIVADEAVSALDVSIQAQVLNLLIDLQKKLGLAYMFVAHNLEVVRYMSDRIAVMYLGRIVESGPTAAVYAAPQHPYTRALIAASPAAHPKNRRTVQPLAGDVPSPAHPPPGCAFHPRCPFASEVCRTVVPALKEIGSVTVACHHAGALGDRGGLG